MTKSSKTETAPAPAREWRTAAMYNIGDMNKGGCGNAGMVLLRVVDTGLLIVRKAMRHEYFERNEIDTLMKLRPHPHVAKLFSTALEGDEFPGRAIGLVYCDMGSTQDVIKEIVDLGIKMPECFVLKMIEDMASAFALLHYGIDLTRGLAQVTRYRGWKPVIHGDAHGGNVLVTTVSKSVYPRFVLADFGETLRDKDHEGYPFQRYHFEDDLSYFHLAAVKTFCADTKTEVSEEVQQLIDDMHAGKLPSLDMFKRAVSIQKKRWGTDGPPPLDERLFPQGYLKQVEEYSAIQYGPEPEAGGFPKDVGGVFPLPVVEGEPYDREASARYAKDHPVECPDEQWHKYTQAW